MSTFKEMTPKEITTNTFDDIANRWMLISAGRENAYNTMTASWGGLGHLFNKDVSFIFVRDHRYTYQFTEKEDYYTLTFFPDGYKKALGFCGANSGRDYDKAKETGLTPVFDKETNAPYFEEANMVFICKKVYADFLKEENFFDKEIVTSSYPDKDFHKLYIGEIVKVLVKE